MQARGQAPSHQEAIMQIFGRVLAFISAAVMLSAAAASAQDWRRNPSFGSVSLNAGFAPDPRTRNVRAGGDIQVNVNNGRCQGWFANAPDYRVNYRAGGYQLTFYVRASGDTMLLINDPNGNWYCNDDYQGLDPAIVFSSPRSGQYDVWVGTYNRSRVSNATLYITEMGAFSR
jgi:hypothetical protein